MQNDLRVIENITNGVKETDEYKNIWLAPLIQFRIENRKNVLIFEFDHPFILGMINFWNYTKTV